jgi:hypothetical protein
VVVRGWTATQRQFYRNVPRDMLNGLDNAADSIVFCNELKRGNDWRVNGQKEPKRLKEKIFQAMGCENQFPVDSTVCGERTWTFGSANHVPQFHAMESPGVH